VSLFHIVSREDWTRYRDGSTYAPPSLGREGFIDLRFEPAAGDSFPHLYGPLNLDAVVDVLPLPLVSGQFEVHEPWRPWRHYFRRR
jgi:uncharacterized protein (DUF952 family)